MAHKWIFTRLYAGNAGIFGEWKCQNCGYETTQTRGVEPEPDEFVWVSDLRLSCDEAQVLDVQGS